MMIQKDIEHPDLQKQPFIHFPPVKGFGALTVGEAKTHLIRALDDPFLFLLWSVHLLTWQSYLLFFEDPIS